MDMLTSHLDNAYERDIQRDTAPDTGRSPLTRRITWVTLALALAGGFGWRAMHHDAATAPAMPIPTLGVATPMVAPVTQWDDYVGRFAPSQSVEIRPRVGGQITARHFRDGDIVQKGQLLFTIDQRPYRAALAEAAANVASARSTLALARNDLARASRLSGDEAISAGELDGLKARLQAAQAALAAAQARQQARALDMEFTQVRAPIAGRISDRRVDVGNLVAAGEGANATLLTTINALDPIYFTFDSSEALYLKAQRDRASGNTSTKVEIKLQDEADYRHQGQLDFTDNSLDPHSGTIRGRAVLANPGLFLTPGMFGAMRLSHGGTVQALLVPDEAIQSDQARKTVLVVGPDGTLAAKPVTLGPVVRGLRVIRSGLAPKDRVVITNLQAAMPGAKVNTRPATFTLQAPTAAPAAINTPAAAQATLAR
ncbi:efflux RND transporter periplasmic adaptor subunit [Novosphingobium humi]|uniref:Efflux RND transporter periplasmic adaptor subunit n=1 Tax=Novosphingobium humi TaxID=2282397 RepID=A0ABY7U295_9SPHN|nr:efflux RND transporter periplasmic adaptor subunit [Novosphingobium humi]WCT79627.1 efflux RND transporter periplasmic adaptor subunit [Novosphingobium humi]